MKDFFTGKPIGFQNGREYYGSFLGLRGHADNAANEVGGYVEDYGLRVLEISPSGEITDANKVGGWSVWK